MVMLLTVVLHYATDEHTRRPLADGLGPLLLVGPIGVASIPNPPPESDEPCSGSATDVRGAKVVYWVGCSCAIHIHYRKADVLCKRSAFCQVLAMVM